MSGPRRILLAAGGTGGHLFPAEALSHVLRARGHHVMLVTDERAAPFATQFPAESKHAVPSATPSGGGIIGKLQAGLVLVRGVIAARRLLGEIAPDLAIGFGGYPTVPPLLAASLAGHKALLHEQNAVIGRANRFLAGRVTAIATGFPQVQGLSQALQAKCRHVGNPVRPAVIEAAAIPFAPLEPNGRLRLLVTGGSQGARIMTEVLPGAIGRFAPEVRARIDLVQQARQEDIPRLKHAYGLINFPAEIQPFFKDLPARIANAHLVIGRAGASTVAELGVIGRPSVLVPLPGSLDQDQAANAAVLEGQGASVRVLQPDFVPRRLADLITEFMAEPSRLTLMAGAAKSSGQPRAAERLADLAEELMG
jgi:UDP-N-acetylglucosamine--N-acetylmuramyl-(pentapeptide) pyrophosphoryl-undecaprenol N-acetylglucosamine transferase